MPKQALTPEEKKARKREYDRARYLERREEILAQNRRWLEENKERKRQTDKAYYEANRERLAEQSREWQRANKEHRREYMSAYYAEHREQLSEQWREYRQRNIESIRAYDRERSSDPERRKRHYLTQQVPRRTADKTVKVKPEEWAHLVRAANGRCLACGNESDIQMDHIVSVKAGGLTRLDNVQPLCRNCNQRKGTKTIDYRDATFLSAVADLTTEAA